MAGSEIRSKIRSVQSTQKITRAMEKVAASKLRKTQSQMRASRPYSERILEVIKHVAQAHPDQTHDLMTHRSVKTVGFIICTSDRGLCGGLNVNLYRFALQQIQALEKEGKRVKIVTVGTKGGQFFKRIGANVIASVQQLGESPAPVTLVGAVQVMLNAYHSDEIQAVYCMHNLFVNSMTQKPKSQPLLPLVSTIAESGSNPNAKENWDYLYEGHPQELLGDLIRRFVEAEVYQGVIENIACEQAARMLAMKNASDNAGDLIDDLRLMYNKARQAAITRELAEIVSGAAAV